MQAPCSESDIEKVLVNNLETILLNLVIAFASWDGSGFSVLLMIGIGWTRCAITGDSVVRQLLT